MREGIQEKDKDPTRRPRSATWGMSLGWSLLASLEAAFVNFLDADLLPVLCCRLGRSDRAPRRR